MAKTFTAPTFIITLTEEQLNLLRHIMRTLDSRLQGNPRAWSHRPDAQGLIYAIETATPQPTE